MRYTNYRHLPAQVVALMADVFRSYDAGDSFSATTLIESPRIVQLKLRHDLIMDYSDLWAPFVGSLLHTHFEDQNQPRLYAELFGYRVSGRPDRIDNTTLIDYKTGGEVSLFQHEKPSWERQLNIYAWLCRQNGITIDRLVVIPIALDWRSSSTKSDTPSTEVNVRLWPDDEQDNYVSTQLLLHASCEHLPDDELPFCTPEQMWVKARKIAVMRKGNKRALKLLDSEDEVAMFFDHSDFTSGRLYLENRPEKRMRCESYCACAPVCNQYKLYKDSSCEDCNRTI